ncbi:MAG: DUF1840 domain-containing protein [Methylophaga sp.]
MIVTFSSPAHADITMFGDVAQQMLKIMGHSGIVPSAFNPQDLPAALAKLEQAVAESKAAEQQPDPDAEFKPGLSQRAMPLISLLKAAIAHNEDVMWNS